MNKWDWFSLKWTVIILLALVLLFLVLGVSNVIIFFVRRPLLIVLGVGLCLVLGVVVIVWILL